MATKITFNIENFKKKLSVYEQSQSEFAGKVALTKLAKRLKGSQGLGQRYERIFDRPVPFTKNSTFTKQRGLELDVGIKDQITKGNPAGKYLFPPIGVGSGKAYETLFTQYLRDKDEINRSDYPVPNTDFSLVRTNKYGNVTQGTYGATKQALGKTRKAKGRTGFAGGNSKIIDGRVFSVKNTGASRNKKLKKGIYRESGKSGIRALFFYGSIPTQKKGGSGGTKVFPEIVEDFANAQLIKIWLREIKELAR